MTREKLPDRRLSETFDVEVKNGRRYIVTASRFPDGRVAEIFVNTPKRVGSEEDVITRDAAIVCSIALQYGAPLEVILSALSLDSQGHPAGALGEALNVLLARAEPPS